MIVHRRVRPQALKAMLSDGDELALFDVREAGQFGVAHLLFATPLPYSRLEIDVVKLAPRKSVRLVLCDEGASGTADLAANRLGAIGYTDVSILEGGTQAWKDAGYALFAGVNVPSKTFGELVEHAYHTPRVTPHELQRMKQSGESLIILDGRPYDEYCKMSIPGAICCPNAELPYRFSSIVHDPSTTVVVNCAGRTRSIIGAQTLINFGVANRVYALENGTQGWTLADLDLEYGASQKYPMQVDPSALAQLQAAASKLSKRFGIERVGGEEVTTWLQQEGRTTYLLDVRTPEEFAAGSIPGALHAPGGQLIQAADQWIGCRNARTVLTDSDGVRAPVVASWLKQLGCNVYVLEGGIDSAVVAKDFRMPALPSIATISALDAKQAIESMTSSIFDLRPSREYRKAHIPGSVWSTRVKIAQSVDRVRGEVVLVTDDFNVARLAAIDLAEQGATAIRALDGGFPAWVDAGYPTESSPAVPPDSECIDYLYFVHDRHAGNRAAMREYLAWERGLLSQLDEQDKALFKI